MKKAIPYYRVSTDQQGQSKLGLEAQQQSVHQFARLNDLSLLQEFTEVESGRKNKRPVLQEALLMCKRENAVLLIAKLDRLGRNVAFISKLMEANVEFVAVDNPYANKLIVHIMAAFAEFEADQISKRTKEALQAAKSRGIALGKHGIILSKKNKAASQKFIREIKPVIIGLQKAGFRTVREIRNELNRLNVPTYHNQKWHLSTVHKILKSI